MSSQDHVLRPSSPGLVKDNWGHSCEVLIPLGEKVKLACASQEESLVGMQIDHYWLLASERKHMSFKSRPVWGTLLRQPSLG